MVCGASPALARGPRASPDDNTFTPAAEPTDDDIADLEDAIGLTTAARLYRQKDYRGALAELAVFVGTNPDSPHLARARFVMAHCLREQKRYEDAAAIYADLIEVYPLMADDSALELGRTRAELKDHGGAVDALDRVSVEHPRWAEAQGLLAWEMFRAGMHKELVERMGRPAGEGPALSPEQSFVVGLSRLKLNDGAGAAVDLRTALLEGSATPGLVGRALAVLVDVKVDGKSQYRDGERRVVAAQQARLVRADGASLVRALGELLARLPAGRLAGEVRFARAQAYLALGQASRAEAELVEAARALGKDDVLRAKARLRAGDAARMQSRFRTALEHYRAATGSPHSGDAESALFGVSDMASRLTRYDAARQALQDLLVRNPLTRSRPRALWSLGWIEYRAGNMAGARQFFHSLVEEGVRGGVGSGEPRALYWAGRASQRMGDVHEAWRAYERVAAEYPVSYYAGLAEKRMLEMESVDAPWPSSMVRPASLASACPGPAPGRGALPGTSDPLLLRARELIQLGLLTEARQALDGFSARVVPTGSPEEDQFVATQLPRAADLEEAVAMSLQLGRAREAFTLRQLQVEGYLPARSLTVLLDHLQRSHPRRYAWLVEAHAQKQRLSPWLVYALTRTESRFRPAATSPADAHGLMQLIMPTAAELARDLGMAPPSRAQLHKPDVNVRLGVFYLRKLLRRFGNEPVYALAGYNAGAAAVERWQRERGTGQVDEFVEEIPFDETRLYVKKVLASYRIYVRLYASSTGEGTSAP